MWYVYLIKNLINGKLYPGKAKNVQNRWSKHKTIAKGGKDIYPKHFQYLHSGIVKYGSENFSITTLSCHNVEAEALVEEMKLIAQYKADGYQLYNLTNGGEGSSGRKCADATKQLISLSNKGRVVSDDTKNILRIINTGKYVSNETKLKHSKARKGKPLSEEHKHHLSISALQGGENNSHAKLTWSKVNSIRELHSQGISYTKLAKQFGVSITQISRICQNKMWKK